MCRSFLTPYTTTGNISKALDYNENESRYWGRFNSLVCSLDLPYIALLAKEKSGDILNNFFNELDIVAEKAHRVLQTRLERLKHVKAKTAPILWMDGALARLDAEETIEPLLHDNYSTISLGYVGLYECVKILTGENHLLNKEANKLAHKIMKQLNDYCAKWKKEEDYGYSLYLTPAESLVYRFATCLKKRFGEDIFIKIDGHDRKYITNSVHYPVWEDIDAFTKLSLESPLQKLSPGGNIIYCETPNLQNNIEAVLEIMKHIYENCMYAEINTKSDYCSECGFDGEIECVEIDGELDWRCPNCGCTDHEKLYISRRTCLYIGSQFWNKGRTQEIKERVLHI